ncbi:MAG: C39 family peptidase [Acetatifactor sp.]|nr:C39 family peptidase [Acetatifactor sp.]
MEVQGEAEYPESLKELLELNPETESFVLGYFQNKDKHPEINLSGEVVQGTIPLFLQWDERWGYETYGSDFLAITGCGPTCLSMVRCGLSGETKWDPLRMAQFAEQEGYYVKGAGTAWDLMTYGAEELDLTVEEIVFDADHILAQLRSGSPIICVMRPGDFTTTGHFIVLTGVDEYGKITVCDPNSKINSEKAWDVETLIPQIKNLWGYRYES